MWQLAPFYKDEVHFSQSSHPDAFGMAFFMGGEGVGIFRKSGDLYVVSARQAAEVSPACQLVYFNAPVEAKPVKPTNLFVVKMQS